MLHLNFLDQISSEALALLIFVTAIIGMFVGYITDFVLGDRGFGPAGNAFLAVLGCVVGIYGRATYFGPTNLDENLMTGGLAASTATVMLLVLGIIKHWTVD